jgi:transcriptional regulator GlxA family with amidase domain
LTFDIPYGPAELADFRSRLLSDDVRRRLAYYPRALEAAKYVRENLNRQIRLEDVADRAGLTPCAFSRYFAEKVGITFSSLVKVLRIEFALSELENCDGAISQLAEQTGYQSGCTFSRAFKEVTGKTPSEYRRRVLFPSSFEEAS